MAEQKKILLIAGEPSGDLHGAALIAELKKMNTSLSFFGMGGDRMKAKGMNLIENIRNMSFLGFFEILKHLPKIRRVKKRILDTVRKENIRTAVLIDYPGFNLNIAKKLKKLNVKIIYYITPQVWAWGKGRVKSIKKLVDKVLVILPFEKEFFRENGINAVFVGHPLLDRIEDYNFVPREKFMLDNNLDPSKKILALLPGSRQHEIETIFPDAIKAAQKIVDEFNMQTVVVCSENLDAAWFRRHSKEYKYTLIEGQGYEILKYSSAGIIKSGTSTLEAALLGLPMIIVYRANPVTYLIGKNLVKLKNIGLVNIIAGETIVPELIQDDLTADNIYNGIKKFLTDEAYCNEVREKLGKASSLLGKSGASRNAASEITGILANA